MEAQKVLEDKSVFKTEHDKVIEYVKSQIGVDLNNFRDGDGTDPYTTTYWDKTGPKTCIDWCGGDNGMDEETRQKLKDLVQKSNGKLILEWGRAWFKYIYLKEES